MTQVSSVRCLPGRSSSKCSAGVLFSLSLLDILRFVCLPVGWCFLFISIFRSMRNPRGCRYFSHVKNIAFFQQNNKNMTFIRIPLCSHI